MTCQPLQDLFLKAFDQSVMDIVASPENRQKWVNLMHLSYDIKYLTSKAQSLNLFTHQTSMLESIISSLARLHFVDSQLRRTAAMAAYDNYDNFRRLIDIDLLIFKILKKIFREIDYCNTQRCQ
jgi:hypothetical protein